MIGLVIHGPEPLDSGFFQDVIKMLDYEVVAYMAGTTGATAVIDAGLEETVKILKFPNISSAVKTLSGNCDLVLVINLGKTQEGSLRLASIVKKRISPSRVPVIMFDQGFHCILSPGGDSLWRDVADRFCPKELIVPYHGDETIRTIFGVKPGENIWVNGNVIGKAIKEKPKIWRDVSGDLCFDGIDIRPSAYSHVKDFDHINAKIRSGKIRRTKAEPRSLSARMGDNVILVDHDAEECLRAREGAHLAVTVGDDTTRIAGSLLYRFSIPVIGIIDGDEDGICDEQLLFPGSMVFVVRPGCDDFVGQALKESLFDGGTTIAEKDVQSVIESVREAVSPYLVTERVH